MAASEIIQPRDHTSKSWVTAVLSPGWISGPPERDISSARNPIEILIHTIHGGCSLRLGYRKAVCVAFDIIRMDELGISGVTNLPALLLSIRAVDDISRFQVQMPPARVSLIAMIWPVAIRIYIPV